MLVKAEVNGKPVEMIFDTGSFVIAFNERALHQLHISIPSDATYGQTVGYGGLSEHNEFEVDSMRLGPITKKNIRVVAMSNAALSTPLLGLPFFGDYQYTVDNEHGLIHFLKR
jgi:clan AA aspartic protease (TIGR02281 family)